MEHIKAASLITAIKTPYLPNGEIDVDTYDTLVEHLIKNGVEGIVVGGTTGEGHLLSWEEHLMLIAHSAKKYGDQLIIIGNTGSNNTREALRATEYGFAIGMDAALQINPYYGRTSIDGLKMHFKRLLEVGPGIIYNVPGRTGQDLTPGIVEELAKNKNLIGLKECAGNDRIAEYEKRGIVCWSGNDDQCHEGRHQAKSHGVISVTANIVPGLMRRLMNQKDEALNTRLQPLIQWLFCEPNPIPLNTALAMTGAIKPVFRLPYVPLSKEVRQKGLEILRSFSNRELTGDVPELLRDEQFFIV
ncbi:4-hydroxy-tetrahydrodipicolinate synthase [Deltaproteobacteria bacterium TL4]